MKIAIVGGTWDRKSGKPSRIVNHVIHRAITEANALDYNIVMTANGGFHGLIPGYIYQMEAYDPDVILWLANVSNDLPKYNYIKVKFPKAIVITSKNNYDKQYTFQEMVAHALALKSNLFIEITKEHQRYYGQVFGPLGNAWTAKTSDFPYLVMQALRRAAYLRSITRKPTVWSPEMPDQISVTKENVKFFDVVNRSADKFHELIHPAEGVKRFLGNASFRCMNGFPSLRSSNGSIYVSRRNIDKRDLGFDKFVQVGYNRSKDITWYLGEHKPSVDTVVQVQLYNWLPNIKFMIHSHVYVKGAPFTETMVPCGGLEEVGEIKHVINKYGIDQDIRFAINLIGHGSLICASTPSGFWGFSYIERPSPELMYEC
jgi:hypothetical protein